jgi:Zn-dependent membrane protease YugP
MNSHEHGFIVQAQKSFIIKCQYKLMVSISKISQLYDTLLLRGQFRTIIISIVIGILLAAKNQIDSRMKR